MTDLRDKLLTLDRKGLEKEAEKLGISVSESMSRAELITLIEKQYALQEFGELKTFSEHRFLIVGLFFVTLATFIILRSSGFFSVGTMEVPYVIYALLGLTFWQLFVTGIVILVCLF